MTQEQFTESRMTMPLLRSSSFPQAYEVSIYDDGFRVYKMDVAYAPPLFIGHMGDVTIESHNLGEVESIYWNEKYRQDEA